MAAAAGGVVLCALAPWWWRYVQMPDIHGVRLLETPERSLGPREQSLLAGYRRQVRAVEAERGETGDFHRRFGDLIKREKRAFEDAHRTPGTEMGESYTVFIWGWQCLPGWLALALALPAAAWAGAMLLVRRLRRWRWGWIASAACSLPAVPVMVLAGRWLAITPRADIVDLTPMTQGPFVGAYGALIGGVVLLAAGAADAVAALLAARRRASAD